MATATVCDYCGNLIEGARVILTEQTVTMGEDGSPLPPDPTTMLQQDFHPECRTTIRRAIQRSRPQPPDLPPTGPPVEG